MHILKNIISIQGPRDVKQFSKAHSNYYETVFLSLKFPPPIIPSSTALFQVLKLEGWTSLFVWGPFCVPLSGGTHWKIKMEPKNHPITKENHMNQTSMTLGSMLIFQGVSVVIFQIFDARFFYAFAWFSNSISGQITIIGYLDIPNCDLGKLL